MSPKQHIKSLAASGARKIFGVRRKVVMVGNLYEKVNFVIQTCAIAHFLRLTEWNNFNGSRMRPKWIFIYEIGTLGSPRGVLKIPYHYIKMQLDVEVSSPAKYSGTLIIGRLLGWAKSGQISEVVHLSR